MATFVLIHGGSADSHYWYRVRPALESAGHEVIAPDLPTGDASADFTAYAQAVIAAVGERSELIIVGQSMGAFTAPIVATNIPTSMMVLLAPMIPAPGETPNQWGVNIGLTEAQQRYAATKGFSPEFDLMTTFMHDVPPEVVEQLLAAGQPEQAETIFDQPFPLDSWPDVSTHVLACTKDRLFPLDVVRRLSQERLSVNADEIESGHLAGFSHPDRVSQKLLLYVEDYSPRR